MRSILYLMVLTFILLILSQTESYPLQVQNEASALLEWKASLDNQSQSTLVSWDRNHPCQSWIGISCSDNPLSEWVVTNITLQGLRLKGSLDSFNFSSFRNLQVLDLYLNDLFGSIPSDLANVSQLRYLDLSNNHFSGVIPSKIGMLPFVEILYIEDNWLPGYIPNSIGNLTNLIELSLFGNQLSGPIPQEIGMLSAKLKYLDFGLNNLTGEIPSFFGNFTHLQFFTLQNNHLSGTIPPELGGAKDLTDLSIRSNHLMGEIPYSLGNLADLGVIYLDYNHLTGPIPESFRNFTNLDCLYLSSNNLSGSYPKHINFSMITEFEVSNNLLSGPLPCVGKLVGLYSVGSNMFSGGIPLEIGNSSSLYTLDLSGNQLSGTIPDIIQNLRFITYLNLDNNLLHGTLPEVPVNLIVYSVKNNKIVGKLPYGICSSRSLEVLHISNNNISGALPDCFKNHNNLTSLNLNGNRLKGLVPRSLMNCRLLQVLDLGNNMLNDTFPRWLDGLSHLQVLILRSNKLHGSIKSSSGEPFFPSLRILDVSRNLFTGHLPTKYFENFKAMMDIDDQERVPTYIDGRYDAKFSTYRDSVVLVVKGLELIFERILTVLTTIDLSDNKFEGEIPSNIKMLNSLRFLNLSHNHLTGQIPAMLDNLTKLESLDISSNQVQGKIPTELTKLTFLVVFNVSGNNLSGTIPQGGQFNTFENDSYQGNPRLCGVPLPKKCGDNDVPSQLRQEEDDDASGFFNGFTWESVVLGYGCGILIGVGLGCLMFSSGKPIWVIKIVTTQRRRKRPEVNVCATRRN